MLNERDIMNMAYYDPIVYALYRRYANGEMNFNELISQIAKKMYESKKELEKQFEQHVSMHASNNNLMRPIQ